MNISEQLTQLRKDFDDVYIAGFEKGKAQSGDTTLIIKNLAKVLQAKGGGSPTSSGASRGTFDNTFENSTIDNATLRAIINNWDNTLVINRASYMFKGMKNISDALYTDKLDFSKCVSLLQAFYGSNITKLKAIDARAAITGWNGMANTFLECNCLVQIDEFYPSTQTNFQGTFANCISLRRVIFKSEIAVSGLELQTSPLLDKESIESIIKNLSGTTTGLTVTLSQEAVDKAFETDEGANDGSASTEWLDLIKPKSNWTIGLS